MKTLQICYFVIILIFYLNKVISGLDVERFKEDTLKYFTKVYTAISKNDDKISNNENEISKLDETFALINVSQCPKVSNIKSVLSNSKYQLRIEKVPFE